MTNSKLLQQISQKECDKEEIAEQVIKKPELLSEVFEGLSADKASIKYGCDKILRIISQKEPSLLYPKIDFFIHNLDCENTFLKWGAIDIIANLAAVDSDKKIEKILDQYFSPIPGPVLITAANVVKAAARIALAKPQLTERITKELMKVEEANYQTTECRRIALGHTIESFDKFFEQIRDKKTVVAFVKRQLN
ncbi:MAG: hypothetical protein D6743_17030, partial [Calditrichaeota bacterium]